MQVGLNEPGIPGEINNIIHSDLTSELKLEKLENLCIKYSKGGYYDKAKICRRKMGELREVSKVKKKKELEEQQLSELESLEEQYQQDIDKFNISWDKKFQQLQEKSEKADKMINEKQQKEMNEFYKQFEQKMPKLKFSKEYLSLENEEKMLVKFQKFDEAKIIKKKKEIQKQKDIDKYNKEKQEKFKLQLMQKNTKHITDKNIIKKKFENELDILRTQKQKEFLYLEKKYQNKRQELDLQQKSERNLAENENICKKRQFGMTYMVNNNENHHSRINTNSNIVTKDTPTSITGNERSIEDEEEKEFQEEEFCKEFLTEHEIDLENSQEH